MLRLTVIRNPSIARKIVLAFLLISLVPAVIVAFVTYKTAVTAHKQKVIDNLIVIAEGKDILFTEYIREKERDIKALSFMSTIIDLLEKYQDAFLRGGTDSPEYISLKKKYNGFFAGLIKEFEYYDFLLVDTDGNVVFTFKREVDLGTNLITGPYKDTEFTKTYKKALEAGETGISDFKYYPPSEMPAAFIGARVKRGDNVLGAVILQLDNENIYGIVQNYIGLGRTGEIVIAARQGDEAVFITPLRHDPEAAFKRRVRLGSKEALPVQDAVLGETGAGSSVDYRNREILAAWRYLPSLRWGMVIKMDIDEAYDHIYKLRNRTIIIVLITIIAVTLTALRISRSISAPIKALHKGSEIIGSGDLDHKVATDTGDEIGELSRAFDNMTMNLKISRKKLENEISERLRVETALKESEEKYHRYFTTIPTGWAFHKVIVDENNRPVDYFFIEVNDAFEKLTGLKKENIIGKRITEVIPGIEKDPADWIGKYGKVSLTGKEIKFESYSEQLKKWFFVSASSPDKGFFITIFEDITERKNIENALRESEIRYRALFSQAPDAITLLDADTGELLEFNDAAHEKFGYTRKEFGELTIPDIQVTESAEEITRHINKILEKGSDVFETENRTKDGQIRNMLINARLISIEGRNVIQSIATDITERMKAEDKLRQVNREMEQVIQVTSHDLRTPLAIVSSYGKEMERFIEEISPLTEKEGFPQEQKEMLKNIQKDIRDTLKYIKSNIRKMDSLLKGLLKLSRSGRIELHIEELDMNRLMDDVKSTFELRIKKAGIKLEITELPPCQGDELQINQVFSNLMGNALKYIDPVRPPRIRISGHKADGQSIYCVEDNGIGIAPEHHEKVFEIFYQADRGARKGEGLGLTMVRKILDRHNGRIWLESEPGMGSRFFVSLPA